MILSMKGHFRTFAVAALVAWALGTFAFIYSYPYQFYNALERSIVQHGLEAQSGSGCSGIPVNTLYAMPSLASPPTTKSNILAGANYDTLYAVGWLDLSKGPEILRVPDMAGRYYSVQFVDPWGDDFAHVGRRTTRTKAGNYLISGPGWHGTLPEGVSQISSPNDRVLLIGRVLVYDDSDRSIAYNLAKQIQLNLPCSSPPVTYRRNRKTHGRSAQVLRAISRVFVD